MINQVKIDALLPIPEWAQPPNMVWICPFKWRGVSDDDLLMLPLPCRCGSERVSTLVCQKGPAGKKLKCPRRWLRYQLVLETCCGLCSGMGTCWCELAWAWTVPLVSCHCSSHLLNNFPLCLTLVPFSLLQQSLIQNHSVILGLFQLGIIM